LTVAFNPQSEYCLDVAQLERKPAPEDSLDALLNQLSVYQGELLPGFYEDWVVLERERLQALSEDKMQRVLERLVSEERWTTVLEWGEKWLALGNTPEPAYRALMLAHSACGDIVRVAAVYQRCVEALRDELGVEPSAETRTLYEQLTGRAEGRSEAEIPRILRGGRRRDETAELPPSSFIWPHPSGRDHPGLHPSAFGEAPASGEPPFKGLEYFDVADAALFFGRELPTAKLVARLRESRFLSVIVGASGSGKSSLIRAGLVPALQKGGSLADGILPPSGSRNWEIHILTPTPHPLTALATSLTRDAESVTATATLLDDLAREPRSLYLHTFRRATAGHPHLLLVVDQFEELFTLCRDEFEREAFVDNLLAAVAPDGGGPLTLVLTLRADFYAHLAQYPELREAVAKQQEYIGPMTAEELRRAIEEPAKRGGWEFEPGLVDLILRDVGDEPGALPLLSHPLLETWKRRSGHTLTLKGYSEAGGVRGAIAQTAETTYLQLTPEQQAIAHNIFLRLTELGEGTEDTRRRATIHELVPNERAEARVRTVLTRLADARLITLGEDSAEVAHEALIREWGRLREWLSADREGLRLHRHLTEAAQEWELLEREPGALYRGAHLAQAREWALTNQERTNELERVFLEASQESVEREAAEREAQRRRELESVMQIAQAAQKLAEEQKHLAEEQRLRADEQKRLAEEQRQRAEEQKLRAEEQSRAARQLRKRAYFLASAFLLAIVLALIALFSGEQARANAIAAQENANRADQERQIEFARELAATAVNNLDVDPERSILLALQAVSVGRPIGGSALSNAEEALHHAVVSSRLRLTLRGHTASVSGAAFSPDGTRLATFSYDGSAKVWDARSGRELFNLPTEFDSVEYDVVHGIAFSPDGKLIATVAPDNGDKVLLWDASTGAALPTTFCCHYNTITSISFSRDGTRLATTSVDGHTHVWDASSGKALLFLPNSTTAAAFSPDGTRLVTDGCAMTPSGVCYAWGAVVWDVSTEKNYSPWEWAPMDLTRCNTTRMARRLPLPATTGLLRSGTRLRGSC
jgi:Novel STAND NTPase 1/Bacterial transcriptional activator domain/WD domain, G-beta repeat